MRKVKDRNGGTFYIYADDIDEWAEIHHRQDFKLGHQYTVHAGPEIVASMRYIKGFPKPGIITIHELIVEPEHWNKGLGMALLERLHADNPDDKIDPGDPSEAGLEFVRHTLVSEPAVWNFVHLRPDVAEKLGVSPGAQSPPRDYPGGP